MTQQAAQPRRTRLNRDRVLRAAVALADQTGTEGLSMRKLAEELGVVPMALYKHVANKEELLDGMIDIVVGEINPPVAGVGWKSAIRQRILSARQSLRRHPWAPAAIQSRADPTPVMLAYLDSMIGIFRSGGFSIDLTHHALHALGTRLLGFTPELFDDSQGLDPQALQALVDAGLMAQYKEFGVGGVARTTIFSSDSLPENEEAHFLSGTAAMPSGNSAAIALVRPSIAHFDMQ